MKRSAIIILALFITIISSAQEVNSTVVRETIQSEILNDYREVSVYLPPSYYSSNQKFPVLYILDGDYNFFYVSGLIELQSAISENIPEMILIGISGKGTETYRKNCKPNIEKIKDKGNADQYINFIQKELVPFVDQNYKTADFKILAGHSVGGLFIINTVLKQPKSFNNFIAISPALWWEKNIINEVARQTFKSNPNFNSNVHISLANETGMGVEEFLAVVKDYKASESVFKFKQFPNENHNSVGLPTYVWALKDIFSTWKGEKQYFTSSTEFKEYLEVVKKKYGSAFNIQPTLLAYTIYILREQPEELEKVKQEIEQLIPTERARFDNAWAARLVSQGKDKEAEKVLKESIKAHPKYFENYHALAKLKLNDNELKTAEQLINQGIELALKQKIRQWQLNELIETREKIKWKESQN